MDSPFASWLFQMQLPARPLSYKPPLRFPMLRREPEGREIREGEESKRPFDRVQ